MSEHHLSSVLMYVGFAVSYAIAGYTSSVMKGDKHFELTKFAKTVALGVVVGFVMSFQQDEPTPEGFEVAAIIAIPIVDQIWNSTWEAIQNYRSTEHDGK